MFRGFSSSLKMSKVSMPVQLFPLAVYSTANVSLVFRALGAAYCGLWALTSVTAVITASGLKTAAAFWLSRLFRAAFDCFPDLFTVKERRGDRALRRS